MSTPEHSPTRVGGRYRLDERIGAGAMGAVWRATDELLNRTVAVKQLLSAAAPATAAGHDALEESRQRILREGRIGARLQHAHVISMFDVVVHEDSPWLVMEYLPSQSLAQVISSKGPLSPVEVADIGRQVADGLAAAHVAGVVHRDVKPGNVLLAEDGRVKLTDFGVSRAVDDVQLTRTGLIAGTPAYLSPEVAQGREPTAASDVFALGATLYSTVEGHPPFGLDDNPYALLHKVATGVVDPPTQAGPIAGILSRLLATDPRDRPSAAQARDELAAIAAGQVGGTDAPATAMFAARPGPPSRPAGAFPPARPPVQRERRRRGPVLWLLLAVLVLAGGITAAVVASNSATQAANSPTDDQSVVTPSLVPPTPNDEPTPEDTPTPTPRTTRPDATPTTPPSPTSVPDVGDPVAFVQNFYDLLPQDVDTAFALLSPEAQSASGGREGFNNFYAGLASVTLQSPQQVDDNTVNAVVVFVQRGGTTTNELYRFVMTTDADGRTIMESFSRR